VPCSFSLLVGYYNFQRATATEKRLPAGVPDFVLEKRSGTTRWGDRDEYTSATLSSSPLSTREAETTRRYLQYNNEYHYHVLEWRPNASPEHRVPKHGDPG